MALHLWTMTEMRWNRKAVSLGSPEDADKRRPKQAKNLSPSSLIGPKVSIATGQNKYVRLSSWYLSFFNFAALSDAAPATKLVSAKCEWASVSGTVASHARHFPSSQLTKVQPTGRPSPERMRPTGSLVEGKYYYYYHYYYFILFFLKLLLLLIIIIFFFRAPSTTFLGALNIEGKYNSGWQMAAC